MKTDSQILFFAQTIRCILLFVAFLDAGLNDRALSGQRLLAQDSCDCLDRDFTVPPNGKENRKSRENQKTLSPRTFQISNNIQPVVVDTIFMNIPDPSGICSDGKSFWVPNYSAVAGSMEIYRIDIHSRIITDSIPAPDQWTTGMAWDGSSLWVTGVDYLLPRPWSCLIRMSKTGQVFGYYSSAYSCYWAGIAWDGTYLYYGINTCRVDESRQTSMIFKATSDSAVIIDSIPPPSGNINGLVYDRGCFWYCDLLTQTIYRITAKGEVITSFPSPGQYPSGLAIEKGYLWNTDILNKCIYQIDIGIAPPIPRLLAGSVVDTSVELSWTVSPADDLKQYNIYRATLNEPSQAVCIDSVSRLQTSYTDRHIVRGEMWYWVSAVDTVGIESHFSKQVSLQVLPPLPENYRLDQNFPNPFNSRTEIRFGLPVSTSVTLKIYDAIGREVATLSSERLSPGVYSRIWDASRMPSGVYFYRLRAGTFDETKKLVMIK
jgi:Secretion system C-terminal sorting domain